MVVLSNVILTCAKSCLFRVFNAVYYFCHIYSFANYMFTKIINIVKIRNVNLSILYRCNRPHLLWCPLTLCIAVVDAWNKLNALSLSISLSLSESQTLACRSDLQSATLLYSWAARQWRYIDLLQCWLTGWQYITRYSVGKSTCPYCRPTHTVGRASRSIRHVYLFTGGRVVYGG